MSITDSNTATIGGSLPLQDTFFALEERNGKSVESVLSILIRFTNSKDTPNPMVTVTEKVKPKCAADWQNYLVKKWRWSSRSWHIFTGLRKENRIQTWSRLWALVLWLLEVCWSMGNYRKPLTFFSHHFVSASLKSSSNWNKWMNRLHIWEI